MLKCEFSTLYVFKRFRAAEGVWPYKAIVTDDVTDFCFFFKFLTVPIYFSSGHTELESAERKRLPLFIMVYDG